MKEEKEEEQPIQLHVSELLKRPRRALIENGRTVTKIRARR